MAICRNAAFLLLSVFSVVVNANSLLTGSVSSDSGRVLSHITVTLSDGNQALTQKTDAFGRYGFESIASGTYQLAFADENFIYYIDEDPYPDEGSVYLNAVFPRSVVVQENQNLDLGDFVLFRADGNDNRQSHATVSDCIEFGNGQGLQTLSYALLNAREITIECTGTLVVPELTISRDIKINAPSGLTLEAAGFNRLLRVLPGIDAQIAGVDLTNGDFIDGIAIYNIGNTTIENAEINGNQGSSATILNRGTLNLRNVHQYRNIVNFDSVLTNTGVVIGTEVVIQDHVASGGPVIGNSGRLELTRCTINGLGTNNVWSVNNAAGSTIKLFSCTFSQSSSPFSNEGTLEIYDSSIVDNSGDQSLIESSGVLKVGGTGITNNDVYGVMVENTGLAELINSTVSGNSSGFGLSDPDYAGTLSNRGLMRVTTSTIANNTHAGVGDFQLGNSGELTISNSIISGVEGGRECGGITPVQSLGHNLHTDGSCGNPQQTDIPFGNSGLLGLAENGGLGKTHALQAGSDGLDAGNCADGALTKDQRGVVRPQGNGCDIGAFEQIVVPNSDPNDESGNNSGNNSGNETGAETGNESGDESEEEITEVTEDGSQDTGSADNPVDVSDETTDAEQTDAPIDGSDSVTPASDESQSSGGGSVPRWQIFILLAFAIGCRRRTYR